MVLVTEKIDGLITFSWFYTIRNLSVWWREVRPVLDEDKEVGIYRKIISHCGCNGLR